MEIPSPDELVGRLRDIPAGRALLERLPDREGIFLIGGAVRDLLLGLEPLELDLVVEGDAKSLARELGGFVIAYDRFGTCKLRLDGHTYDIATARVETYEHPGALPAVTPAPLRDDFRRRDFTINAIALALGGELRGRIEAPPRALEDLDAGVLRVFHDSSFRDDPTRLLRLARYAGRLGFTIERHTRELALEAIATGALETASGGRIGSELRLLAREHEPLRCFAALGELRLDSAIDARFGIDDPAPVARALSLLPAEGRPDLLVLAAASENVPRPDLHRLLDRLAFEAADRDRVACAASGAMALARVLEQARTPAQIAAAAGSAPIEMVALAGGHGGEEAAAEWLEHLRHVRLEIGGEDLLAAGVPEGPLIGRGLHAALSAKLDGRICGRQAELSEALRAVR